MPMPTRPKRGCRILARCPGDFIKPSWACCSVWANARFSPAVLNRTRLFRIRSNGSSPSGFTCAKKPRANISPECARATTRISLSAFNTVKPSFSVPHLQGLTSWPPGLHVRLDFLRYTEALQILLSPALLP